jgi:hypothetical protein
MNIIWKKSLFLFYPFRVFHYIPSGSGLHIICVAELAVCNFRETGKLIKGRYNDMEKQNMIGKM